VGVGMIVELANRGPNFRGRCRCYRVGPINGTRTVAVETLALAATLRMSIGQNISLSMAKFAQAAPHLNRGVSEGQTMW